MKYVLLVNNTVVLNYNSVLFYKMGVFKTMFSNEK